ncbi:PTI1-like tyrosine-protein kinase At3g15890 [Selaginella moellendorffii]|uniref:PTI1-like tyrosine-protein kinase At3g15890 n=1 Tax=Selaginella moellendorffii TaxID=88036 RepID=UPI000D1C7168|nr:PTI1-like tyrosine-protein kinase At3g15890 [Selaginella moellendorffii]|eukprot:XP_024536227.1 PTI1-like tyrosine-protein kinase At3g15890 [Selaginella moellendorffii]
MSRDLRDSHAPPCGDNQDSCVDSPMPYLVAALGAMLLLVVLTQTLRLISYLRTSQNLRAAASAQQHLQLRPAAGDDHQQVESKLTPGQCREIVVIMAGDEAPTFLAEPTRVETPTRHRGVYFCASAKMLPAQSAFLRMFCCHGPLTSYQEDHKGGSSSWRIFTFKELINATSNFSDDRKLGEGGFGSVFWGQLSDGTQHRNLLKLRGYCTDGQERIIVYDYMPNLSLLSHLHGKLGSSACLSWPKRVKIAMGSAEAIEDVKASNVLIDANFEAQIADFGFAKFVPEGVTHMTTRVKGTLGYLAPEYAMWGKVSESCDVYSFGILLLELISGRKPIEKMGSGMKRTIVEWAAPLVFQGKFEDLVDPKLQGKFSMLQLKKLVHAATLCAQSNPENRPTMREVVAILKEKRLDMTSGSFRMDTVKYRQELLDEED